jgi:hypothetical protein
MNSRRRVDSTVMRFLAALMLAAGQVAQKLIGYTRWARGKACVFQVQATKKETIS